MLYSYLLISVNGIRNGEWGDHVTLQAAADTVLLPHTLIFQLVALTFYQALALFVFMYFSYSNLIEVFIHMELR